MNLSSFGEVCAYDLLKFIRNSGYLGIARPGNFNLFTIRGETLKVFIIAHQCGESGGLSVGINVVKALVNAALDNQYLITIPRDRGYEQLCSKMIACETYTIERAGLLTRWFCETFKLPKIIEKFNPDLIIALGDRGIVNPPCPQAIYFHRPALVYPPKHYSKESFKNKILFKYHSRFLAKCLPKTQLIICQTKIVKERFCREYKYTGDVLVSPPSISSVVRDKKNGYLTPPPLEKFSNHFKLLYLARFYPHKNHESIVECFHKFKGELEDVVVFITVDENQHPMAKEFLSSIEKLGLSKSIVPIGRIEHEEVPAYYHYCDGLLMPTLLETFGLPYIEAMSFEKPILTSDIDFARDVCGETAHYFDPWDSASMKDAILTLKNDPELRRSLSAKCCSRLSKVSGSWGGMMNDVMARFKKTD